MANDINYVSSVENQLIDAMSQISTSTVKNLNADETIIAQVVECLDISLGKYKLKYQWKNILLYFKSNIYYII